MGWLWLSQAVLQFLKFFSFCDEFLDRRLLIFLSLTSVLLSVLCGQLLILI